MPGRFFVFTCVVLLTGGTGLAPRSHAGEAKPTVFVSIVPQAYFVDRIGSGRVEVKVMVQPGHSPATYEPTPRQMAALSEAKLYFRIGVPFEDAFLHKIERTMKNLKIVDTRKGITLRKMKAHHHENEAHHEDPEGEEEKHEAHADGEHQGEEHNHQGMDPHIWLNPRLVKVQASTVTEALTALDPAGEAVYKKNYAALAKDLDGLDAKLKKALVPVKGKTFLVFHPAWGYFADAYGLKQEPVEIEGKEPSGRQLARIIDQARAEDVKVIFVQPQFSQTSAKAVAAAIQGAVVPIDPLARDYIKNLEGVAMTVGQALGRQK